MKTKICTKCKKEKFLSDFYKDKKHSDGLRSDCKECFNLRIKKYYSEHRGQFKTYWLKNKDKIKKYRNKNKDKINKYNKNYRNQRRYTDIKYRILLNLRCRIGKTIKRNSKSESTKKLLGCTVEYLKRHLEARFTEGMSWDNYGRGDNGKREWHIDHIKSCASFDLSKPEEQKACFHFSNLQPLWAIDNKSKGVN